MMKDLIIKETKKKPGIRFFKNGYLSIEGRSLSEHLYEFYLPLLSWCKKLEVSEVQLDFKVEYLNAASARYIFGIIKNLEENRHVKNIDVRWFYDANDNSLFDLGQIISEINTKAKVSYYTLIDIDFNMN